MTLPWSEPGSAVDNNVAQEGRQMASAAETRNNVSQSVTCALGMKTTIMSKPVSRPEAAVKALMENRVER